AVNLRGPDRHERQTKVRRTSLQKMKRSLTYLPYCLIPLLLLAAFSYWNGLKTVNETLSAQAQTHLNLLAGEIDHRLREEEIELTRVAASPELHDVVSKGDASVSTRVPV